MAPNSNTKTVDVMIRELEVIFKENYLNHRKKQEPYEEIISQIKPYKNARMIKELKCAIKNKINSNEMFANLDFKIWSTIFVIVPLIITMIGDFILKDYNNLHISSILAKEYIIGFIVILVFTEVALYCYFVFKEIRIKYKEKCFYEFVQDILEC